MFVHNMNNIPPTGNKANIIQYTSSIFPYVSTNFSIKYNTDTQYLKRAKSLYNIVIINDLIKTFSFLAVSGSLILC